MRLTSTCILALTFALAYSALARLGETPKQCEARYGKHVEERKGGVGIPAIRVYTNRGFRVTAVYIAKPYSRPKVGCIVYGKSSVSEYHKLTDQERAGLMATIPGKWRPFTRTATLAGKKPSIKGMSIKTNQIAQDKRDKGQAMLSALSTTILPSKTWMDRRVSAISHNGSRSFAYHHGNRLILISLDGIQAFERWQRELAATPKPESESPPEPLTGF